MNDSVFEIVEKSSQILKLDFSSIEFAKLAEEQELSEAQIQAVGMVFEHLQQKKIAYRMFSKITYCSNPKCKGDDYCWDTLKDFHEEFIWDDPVSNYIQLTFNKDMELPEHDSTEEYKKKYLESAIKEPEVELRIIPTIEAVRYDGDFDFVVMAQSPNYTPASADFIMNIFKEYIIEV